MSRAPATLSRARPSTGLDYEALREEALGLVQTFSGEIWTNFNESDPGVTILEQLCYALTELAYRAQFPVQDLLASPRDGGLNLARHGLYPPWDALPTAPVTAADLARLILDRVEGVANAWFLPREPATPSAAPTGLYDVFLLLAGDRAENIEAREAARISVLDAFAAHRALCEDVERVHVLTPLALRVEADVELEDGIDPESVLARLLFNLERLLAPEPRRVSLAGRLADGATMADVFAGPAMRRGFIEDDQMVPAPASRPVDDLLRVMAETDGVLEVAALMVRIEGEEAGFEPGDILPLPWGQVFRLITHPRGGRHTIRLWRGPRHARPDSERVRRLLRGLWDDQRRAHDLDAEFAADLAPPPGRDRDLAAYESVQEQFPDVYGIGAYGLPQDATPARRGQTRQLKGYLMAFDQMMADVCGQLAHVSELYSITAGGQATYAFQSLATIAPDAAPLLSPDYQAGLAALVAEHDPVMARQNQVLDLLLSLHGLSLEPPPGPWDDGAGGEHLRATLLRSKQSLLTRLIDATAGRGRGFNHRAPGDGRAGLEILARLELDILRAAHAHHGPRPARHVAEISVGWLAPRAIWSALEARPGLETELSTGVEDEARGDAAALAGHAVAAALLPALAEARRYRLHANVETRMVELVCRDDDGHWWVVGEYEAETVAIVAARGFARAARTHRHHHDHALHIVEWPLLRFADDPGGEDDPHQPFRITAVLPVEPPGVDRDAWRLDTFEILRRGAPAHVVLECVHLREDAMEEFLGLRRTWIDSLRPEWESERPVEWALQRAEACRRMKRFLRRHAPRTRRNTTEGS